jgi:uncharacterized protein YjdB
MSSSRHRNPRLQRAMAAWCLLSVACLAACGGSVTGNDLAAPEVAEVIIAPLTATVVVGNSLPLQATVRDAAGRMIDGPAIVWSVQDTTVAAVSSTGVVTGRAVGSTQVAASSNGRSGIAALTVLPMPVASVSVSPARVDLAPGARSELTVVTADAAGKALSGRTVMWASSNPAVASVDATGVITAVAPGTATISATSEGVSGAASVSVVVPTITSVVLQPHGATVQRGATLQLSATVTDASGAIVTNRVLTWTSSNTGIAVVSTSGLVTANAIGSTRVIASLDGKADTVAISVVVVPVGSVTIQPGAATLGVGQSATLTATVRDANGAVVTDRAVGWTSSNTAVATVTQAGVVKAIAGGAATISATSEGNSGSATVTVAASVASITLQPTSVTLQRNASATLAPTLKDAGGNVLAGRTVTWISSDTTKARVSSTGVVTAVRIGTATITATSEGRSASASVTVVTGPVDHVVITPSSVTGLRAGQNVQLSASALDANGDVISGARFTWHSNSTAVATVSSSGLVVGVRTGSTTITATYSGKTGSASVSVR